MVKRAPDDTVGGFLDVDVLKDDGRIFPAQLKVNGNGEFGRLLHHLAAARHASRKVDFIGPLVNKFAARFLGAINHLDGIFHEAAAFEHILKDAFQRCVLGRLHNNGITGQKSQNGWPQGLKEREVPGGDHLNDAQRLIGDFGLFTHQDDWCCYFLIRQGFWRPFAEVVDQIAHFKDLRNKRIEARFAGLFHNTVDDLFPVGDHVIGNLINFRYSLFDR